MIGIISRDNIDKVGHSLFLNFRIALKNYLKQDFKNVNDVNDLSKIDTLFIVDEHYSPHVEVWKNDTFINELNSKNIKTVVFNFERIHSKSFPWNVDHQRKLETIKNLVQFVSDVDDARHYNKPFVNKQYLSKDTTLIEPIKDKKERVLFIGQVNNYYPTRRKVISDMSATGIPFDIIITDRKYTYAEFLRKINEYKYIFNPLGTGKFLNLRFYEALKLGCIPIQQITEDMANWYSELTRCYKFTSVDQISFNLLQKFQTVNQDFYLEDYFESVNLKSFIG